MLRFDPPSLKRPALLGMAAVLLMSTCAVTTAQAQPRLVKDADVQPCRLVGQVSANSGYGKNNDWKGIAKFAALQRAENLGASDIVVDRYTPVGAFNGQVEARAYVCGNPVIKAADNGGE